MTNHKIKMMWKTLIDYKRWLNIQIKSPFSFKSHAKPHNSLTQTASELTGGPGGPGLPGGPSLPFNKKTSIALTCITQSTSPNTAWDCIENQGQRHAALLANDVHNNSFQTERLEVLCMDSLPLGPTGRTLSGADQLMKTNEKCLHFLSTSYLNTTGHTASSSKHIWQHIHIFKAFARVSLHSFVREYVCPYRCRMARANNYKKDEKWKGVVPRV